ncbi:hypothetical protein SAMN06296273_0162 [Nitrosomonas ureae]|uniref:Uncharacterized protein n=1 Tax=Nitrosomonas ureae TaxID=44577 RepID=A0A285BTT1_9PROT|nr:hypothetical protein SAMN06296273_0162 [Nitrosomonas ureae]
MIIGLFCNNYPYVLNLLIVSDGLAQFIIAYIPVNYREILPLPRLDRRLLIYKYFFLQHLQS